MTLYPKYPWTPNVKKLLFFSRFLYFSFQDFCIFLFKISVFFFSRFLYFFFQDFCIFLVNWIYLIYIFRSNYYWRLLNVFIWPICLFHVYLKVLFYSSLIVSLYRIKQFIPNITNLILNCKNKVENTKSCNDSSFSNFTTFTFLFQSKYIFSMTFYVTIVCIVQL